ncbi:hypothetical protein [Flavobacterium cellulosilyticum]|uniref:Uncharacterized protein n=1 Tax=Flavobacterium cellulosilyticum TaxID=2541731 RepID=A0A4V2YYW2_9FLAO|nr:hypothetical protein [Flavobacterium cellulosilyticum]TDD94737.1 hypothetical protein E0F76_16035 [Flavobacterium cellulosilyticum]
MMEQDALILKHYIEANAKSKGNIDRYRINKQYFDLDFIRSKYDEHDKTNPTKFRWKKAVFNGNKIHNDHFGILDSSNDKELIQMIQDILNKKHANI